MTEEDDLSKRNALKIIIPAEMIKDEGYGYPLQYKGKEKKFNRENIKDEGYWLNLLNLYKVKEIKVMKKAST